MRKALLLFCLMSAAFAQQPQTHDVPAGGLTPEVVVGSNSKWTQGVGPGYWPTAGAGLTLKLTAGTAFCSGAIVTYAGGTLTMTNTTNYIYLNTLSSCVPAVKTSTFTSADIPVAVVVATAGAITTITDDRTYFFNGGSAGYILQVNGATLTAGDTVNFNDTTPAAAANGLNVKWQKSTASTTDSVSAYVPGDGDATHCLNGTMTFGACPVTGGNVLHALPFTIGNPSGPALATATTDYLTVPFACTMQAYNLVIDAGTVTVKFWKIGTGTAIPTSSNSISTSGVSISSGTAIHSVTLSDFTTTAVTQNDILAMSITAASGVHYAEGTLQCLETNTVNGVAFSIGDPSGATLSSGSTTTSYVTVPFGCTLQAYNLIVDAGTVTVKFWKIATGTAIPTSSNSINTSGVGISTGTAIHSATLSDFTTTSITQNDIMAMNVTAVSTAKYVQGVLQCAQ